MTIDGAETMEDAMRKIFRERTASKPTSELVRLLVGYWMDADASWGAVGALEASELAAELDRRCPPPTAADGGNVMTSGPLERG